MQMLSSIEANCEVANYSEKLTQWDVFFIGSNWCCNTLALFRDSALCRPLASFFMGRRRIGERLFERPEFFRFSPTLLVFTQHTVRKNSKKHTKKTLGSGEKNADEKWKNARWGYISLRWHWRRSCAPVSTVHSKTWTNVSLTDANTHAFVDVPQFLSNWVDLRNIGNLQKESAIDCFKNDASLLFAALRILLKSLSVLELLRCASSKKGAYTLLELNKAEKVMYLKDHGSFNFEQWMSWRQWRILWLIVHERAFICSIRLKKLVHFFAVRTVRGNAGLCRGAYVNRPITTSQRNYTITRSFFSKNAVFLYSTCWKQDSVAP